MNFFKNVYESVQILSNTNIDWSLSAGPIWLVGGIIIIAVVATIHAFCD